MAEATRLGVEVVGPAWFSAATSATADAEESGDGGAPSYGAPPVAPSGLSSSPCSLLGGSRPWHGAF